MERTQAVNTCEPQNKKIYYSSTHTLILKLHANFKHTYTRSDFEVSPLKIEEPVQTRLNVEHA